MKYDKRFVHQSAIVYLYDPVPLEKVSLDALKVCFERVVALPDLEAIHAEAPQARAKVQILTARTEYTDESGAEFDKTDLAPIQTILKAMPPFNLKAYGINLHLRLIPSGYTMAGAYTTDNYLANSKALEAKLGGKILASGHRFLYGEMAKYFDVRLTPVKLDGELLHLQLHMHKDLHLTDAERILQETHVGHGEAVKELARLEELL